MSLESEKGKGKKKFADDGRSETRGVLRGPRGPKNHLLSKFALLRVLGHFLQNYDEAENLIPNQFSDQGLPERIYPHHCQKVCLWCLVIKHFKNFKGM